MAATRKKAKAKSPNASAQLLENYTPSPEWQRLQELRAQKPTPRFSVLWVLLVAEALFLFALVALWWMAGA